MTCRTSTTVETFIWKDACWGWTRIALRCQKVKIKNLTRIENYPIKILPFPQASPSRERRFVISGLSLATFSAVKTECVGDIIASALVQKGEASATVPPVTTTGTPEVSAKRSPPLSSPAAPQLGLARRRPLPRQPPPRSSGSSPRTPSPGRNCQRRLLKLQTWAMKNVCKNWMGQTSSQTFYCHFSGSKL